MNEGEKFDPLVDPYIDQVVEKVKMTRWSLELLSEIDDQINDHFLAL